METMLTAACFEGQELQVLQYRSNAEEMKAMEFNRSNTNLSM